MGAKPGTGGAVYWITVNYVSSVRGLDHGRSSQSWGPTVEVHHSRRPGRGRRAGPGRVPRGRRQVRRGGIVDRVSLACAGPPGRPSVLPDGGGRGAVLGRRENRPDGGKIPILHPVVLRIGLPLETEKKRENGARSSQNPGLLPP